MSAPTILGPDGSPMVRPAPVPAPRVRSAPPAAPRTAMTSFAGASHTDSDLALWEPTHASGASALFGERDTLVARVHDLARNDGWASGGITRQVDAIIGAGWRLSAKPNARSLGLRTATGAIDYDAADEFGSDIEAAWRDYVEDPDCWCDVGRRFTMGGLLALAFRHRIMDGEALAALLWRPRGGPFATAVQIIDPDRLSNPSNGFEQKYLRQGVELDGDFAPVAYHIRVSHPGDLYLGTDPWRWERVPRETSFGRRVMVHAYEPERADQIRGTPLLAPVIKKLKMLGRYDEAELQAAVLNAILAAFIESPYDHDQVASLMSDGDAAEELSAYQRMRLGFHEAAPLKLGGVKLNFLSPGEKVSLTNPNHPNQVFEHFTRASLRNVASAMGMTYEQLSMDWGQVNYSSARAALLEVWRGFTARKEHFAAQFMQPIYAAWLEEALDRGIVRAPKGAPPFRAKKAAYCAAKWIGPARGWVDPLKEASAAIERLDAGMSTREREAAEQGSDWQEDAQQQARERRYLQALGIDPDAEEGRGRKARRRAAREDKDDEGR
ncbi:phage portal protein [Methylobacterium oryzihabitans]|nr:phage portal protein [Methylobacterium oryzihabitans]